MYQRAPHGYGHRLREPVHRVADARSRSVAHRDEIEDAEAASVVVDEFDFVRARRAHARDSDSAAHLGAARDERAVEGLEEHPAMQSHAEEPLGQHRVVKIEDGSALRRLADEARYARATADDALREAEALEDEQP
jgi:hypothetical protein